MTHKIRSILSGVALAALWFTPALQAQSDAVRSPPGAIAGTVMLDGCRAEEVAVTLRAEPLALPSSGVDATDFAVPRTALATAVPVGERSFSFRLEGLADGQLYRVGIKARRKAPLDAQLMGPPVAWPPNPCDTIVWEGLPASVAVAGGDLVQVRGRAISGQLQVRTEETRNGARGWSRAGLFSLDDAAGGQVALRWTPPAGVTRGVLQIALERFDRELSRDQCVSPQGLLHATEVSVSPREIGGDPVFELPAVQISQLIVPPVELRDASSDGGTRPATVTEAEYAKLLLGKPLYVRVVPVDEANPAGGPRCNRVSEGLPAWVVLVLAKAVGGPPPVPPAADELSVVSPVTYRGPVVFSYPNYNHLCMRSTKGHTLHWGLPTDFLVINNTGYGHGDWFPAGKRFCWKTGGSGGFDPVGAVVEVLGGVLTPLEWLVNSVAGSWESLKKFAVNAVASGIGTLGIECGSTCKAVLSAGLEIGLAAAGIPPTIPNFDQLKEQGLDYVAAQIASQTGLPDSVTNWAVSQGYKTMAAKFTDQISEARGSSSGLPNVNWATWDNGIEPATLQFSLQRSAVGKLPTGLSFMSNAVHAHQFVGVPRVMLDHNGYPGATSMTFNVALSPNLSGWQAPGPKTVSMFGVSSTFDPTVQEVAGSLKNYWKTLIQQHPCVPMAIDRVAVILLPVPAGRLADFPSVPVMLNSTPHHAPLLLYPGQPSCYLAGIVQ